MGGILMKKLLSLTLTAAFIFTVLLGTMAFGAPKKTYVDGAYKASYDVLDSHGWKAQISITIKGDKITAAKFDYVNAQGKLKTMDPAYNTTMKKFSKTYPALYCAQLNQSLVKSQNPDKVDVITGATHSSENFKTLAKAAIANAKKGNKATAIVVWDDTYTATADKFDSHGWKPTVSVTYKDGKLVKVDFDYLNKDNKKKSQDDAYNTNMKKLSKNGMDVKTAIPMLTDGYLKNGKVDVVTGATSTSDDFKTYLEKALAMRK
jgi:major membrane immunogen (membrane-anchored lipoprotein)